MEVSFNGGAKFNEKKQAFDELAFCHYPVTVSTENGRAEFDGFDEAKEYVVALFSFDSPPQRDN